MKYILIDEVNGDQYTSESNDFEALAKKAEREWSYLTDAEKENRSAFFIIESINPDEEAENHFDGNVLKDWKEKNKFKEMLNRHHLSIKQASDRFDIPYRTVQNWAAGYRECPGYIIKMMDEILNK